MNQEADKDNNHILVVDDTKSDRDLFKFLLGRHGFVVETATDGAQALEVMEKKDFDLVLCDYLMPKVDGYEFLQKIRQQDRFSHVIVIIITSDESDETKAKLLKGGASDFVHKGDSHEEIVARINVHLRVQSAKADLRILELTFELANKISQPLSVLIAALDVLKEKIQTELPESRQQGFQELLNALNKEADSMVVISEDLKRLSMDIHHKN